MEERPRILAIDYGTRRVGVAISDPLKLFAQPVDTCTPTDVLDRVSTINDQFGIESIVVGWPLLLDGDETTALTMVQPFINRLEHRFPDIEIIKWDERFSSERAKEALYDAGVSKKARRSKDRVNAAAAAVILQEYLDALKDNRYGSSLQS